MSKTTIPKYSYVIIVAQFVIGAATIVFLILDEFRLWAYLYTLFILITGIQFYRLRRARNHLEREYILQIRNAIAEYQNRELTLHESQPTIEDDLEGLREDIKRHRLAKDDV